ncbi:MAG TPA: co-chaperone GroES [Ignavibacteria bacterium]|jgi:chaperonin GroES
MNLKPLGDRVIVKPKAPEEKTKGGIILPDTAQEKPMEGEIVAVGTGRIADDGKKINMELKVGDKILYGKYSGTEVKINDDEYLIMREGDVYAVIS